MRHSFFIFCVIQISFSNQPVSGELCLINRAIFYFKCFYHKRTCYMEKYISHFFSNVFKMCKTSIKRALRCFSIHLSLSPLMRHTILLHKCEKRGGSYIFYASLLFQSMSCHFSGKANLKRNSTNVTQIMIGLTYILNLHFQGQFTEQCN